MSRTLNLRAVAGRLAAALRSRRGRAIAALLVFALGIFLLAGLTHRPSGRAPRNARPLLSPSSVPAASQAAASPSAAPAASPSPTSNGNDGAGSDDNPASAGGFAQAVITSGPTDPAEAAVNMLVKYLNTLGRSDREWRDNVRPLVTPDLAAQIDQADMSRVPVGIIDTGSAVVRATGDQQVQVTLRLVASHEEPNKVVGTIVVTLDGSTGRWLVSQLDEVKPQ